MGNLTVAFDQVYGGNYGINDDILPKNLVSGLTKTTVGSHTFLEANSTTHIAGNDHLNNGKLSWLVGDVTGSGSSIDGYFSFDVKRSAADKVTDARVVQDVVKDARAISDGAEHLYFSEFTHVDVKLGDTKLGHGFAGSDVFVNNSKRAKVSTGSGNDHIEIKLLSPWVDHTAGKTGVGAKAGKGANSWYDVSGGKGADYIEFQKGSVAEYNGGIKGKNAVNPKDFTEDGHNSWAVVDLGANDKAADTLLIGNKVHLQDMFVKNYEVNDRITYVDDHGYLTKIAIDNKHVQTFYVDGHEYHGHSGVGVFNWVHIIQW